MATAPPAALAPLVSASSISISDSEYDPSSLSSTALTSPFLDPSDVEREYPNEAVRGAGEGGAQSEEAPADGEISVRTVPDTSSARLGQAHHIGHVVDEKKGFTKLSVDPSAPAIIVTSVMPDANPMMSKRHHRTDSDALTYTGDDLGPESEKADDAHFNNNGRAHFTDEKHDSPFLSLSSPPPSPTSRTGLLPSVSPSSGGPSITPPRTPRPYTVRAFSLLGYGKSRALLLESSRARLTVKKFRTTSEVVARAFSTPAMLLFLYFAFSLGLTLYNKAVMVGFPFPYTLTAIHTLCGSIGCLFALELGYFEPQPVDVSGYLTLGIFSILYTINIAISNISLHMVTVPFHQVVRAATPLFTIAIAALVTPDRRRPGRQRILSLLPVVAGVGLATYGDYYFTMWGLVLTLLGTFLAACKTVATNVLQSLPATGASSLPLPSSPLKVRPPKRFALQRMQFHPLDLLLRMSPIAFVQCILYAWLSGELERVGVFGATEMTRPRALSLLVNGVIAFGVNVISFTANKRTGPLTMTVAANVKQVLTIVLAVIIFDLTITPTHFLGVLLTLVGGAWYAAVEYADRRKAIAIRGQ